VLADGDRQAATGTDSWGLSTEPWIFVVDGDGKVTAKFEAAVGEEELRAALDAVAPTTGSVEGLVTTVDQASSREPRTTPGALVAEAGMRAPCGPPALPYFVKLKMAVCIEPSIRVTVSPRHVTAHHFLVFQAWV